jgi:hypothetical protein
LENKDDNVDNHGSDDDNNGSDDDNDNTGSDDEDDNDDIAFDCVIYQIFSIILCNISNQFLIERINLFYRIL